MEHLFSGAVSGLASCVILQPFDLVKTRLQQQQQQHQALDLAGKRVSIASIPGTARSTVRDIIAKEGVWKLWRGTVPTILRNVPGTGLYFATLSEIRTLLSKTKILGGELSSPKNSSSTMPVLSRTNNLIAGGTARAIVGFVLMPISVVKVRYESNLYNYSSIWQAFHSIYRNDGIKGLFYGTGATLARDAPYAGLYVLFYEQCKQSIRQWTKAHEKNIPSAAQHMVSGMTAGLTATVVTQPFDLLKTRMQLKPLDYRNMPQAAVKVFREEGMIGFFDGMLVRTARKTVSTAITWTLYEELVSLYRNRSSTTNA